VTFFLKMNDFQYKTKLRDGTPILIRSIQPDDKGQLKDGFNKLSAKSRFLRFMSHIGKLSNNTLKYLTEIDNVNHVALGAADMSGGIEHGVGIARYIRLADEPDVAEFAIVVVDDYHKKGIGTLLLKLLMQCAQKNGIRSFRAFVLRENTAMIKMLNRLGAQSQKEDATLLKFDLALNASHQEINDN